VLQAAVRSRLRAAPRAAARRCPSRPAAPILRPGTRRPGTRVPARRARPEWIPAHTTRKSSMNALRLTALLFVLAATPALQARDAAELTACERNFAVEGSFLGGRTYTTEAVVPGATYPDALYRVRDKLVEQGLE